MSNNNFSIATGLLFAAILLVCIVATNLSSITLPLACLGVFFGAFASVLSGLMFWDSLKMFDARRAVPCTA